MKFITNRTVNIMIMVIISIFIFVVIGSFWYIYKGKSYVNDYMKKHYTVVIVNDTEYKIDKVKLLIDDIENDVAIIEDNDIVKGEYRKLSIDIKDEKLLQISGSSYNVIVTFVIDNQEYRVPAGYFTLEWGIFRVVQVKMDNNNKYVFDYKNDDGDKLYKSLLKRHYYNSQEKSWFDG